MIQTVFEYKKNDSPINRISQLRDNNYFYFRILKSGFEVNLKNGKIKSTEFYYDKSKYTVFNNYYLSCDKSIKVYNDNDKILFFKTLYDEGKVIIINEKEGLFAVLSFVESCYSMNLYIFKIDKNND